MLQQSRTMRGILVLWGLSLGMVIAGCGGGGDTSEPIEQPPPNVATPASLSNQGLRFPTGTPFRISSELVMRGDVLLSFGDFQSTNSAPFTLVAGGFRATGRATWLNIYTLSVQESTFPAGLGPKVGDQLFIVIDSTAQAQEVNVPEPNGVRDFTRATLTGNPIQASRNCDTKTGTGDPVDLGTLIPAGPATPRGCTMVNGSLDVQKGGQFGPTNTYKLTLSPGDQIVQFVLTYPPTTAADAFNVDFDLVISKDDPNIKNRTNVLQTCLSTVVRQEVCSIVLQQTDFVAGNPLPIEIAVFTRISTGTQGGGNYTLEILSNESLEVRNRTNICPNTGPSVILEQEPNGKSVYDPARGFYFTVTDPLLFQGVGMLRLKDGCIPIRGGHLGASLIDAIRNPAGNITNNAEADGTDNFEFPVEGTVRTVAFLMNPTNLNNNAFALFIDEVTLQGSFNNLASCATTAFFGSPASLPGTPVITCAVSVPPSRNLRVQVFSGFVCTVKPCLAESDYSLDIIALEQPSILVNQPVTVSPGGRGGVVFSQ